MLLLVLQAIQEAPDAVSFAGKATFERGMVTVTLPVTQGVPQSAGRIVIEVERL